MNSPAKYVPLTLLMGNGASAVDTELRSLLDSGTELSLSQPGSINGSVFEVVYIGVTLRLTISANVPDMQSFKKIFCNLESSSVGCVIELELGDHVIGGERVPAIIRALLGASQKLGSSLGAVGTIWHPASIVSGFGYFSGTVADYLDGGAFPVLALVNFKGAADGTIESTGLSYVSGQELQIAGDLEQSEIMRRVVRVAHDIAINGAIQVGTKISGIELNEALAFSDLPAPGRIRLNIYSNLDT